MSKITSKNLADFSKTELKEWLDSIDDFLFDCDGVLYTFTQHFDGVKETIAQLKKMGKNVKYVTNNTTNMREAVIARMQAAGIDASIDDVLNPTVGIIHYLKKINFDKKIYVIGMPSIRKELERAGFKIANPYEPDLIEITWPAIIKSLEIQPDVGAVIVCMDFNLTMNSLNKAYFYLLKPEVLFITTATDTRVPTFDGRHFLGPGHIQALLKNATNRDSIEMGKPEKDFGEFVQDYVKCNPKRAIFVGDSLEQDIGFGKVLGYKQLLVLTGSTTKKELENVSDELNPSHYVRCLGDIYFLMRDNDLL